MLPKEIKSLQHPFVKKIVKLRKEKDFRKNERLVFVMGKKVVLEISKRITPTTLLITNSKITLDIAAEKVLITKQIMNKLAGIDTTEEIAALFPMPTEKPLSNEKSILVVDKVSDPGNLGTLFRSALALNFNAIVLMHGTVDPFNDKAIRASKGACFLLPFCYETESSLYKLMKEKNITGYLADMNGADIKKVKFKTPCALILSNEAKGKQEWPEDFITIAIPMNKDVESLNVATSGSILMYVMKNA